ncbi:cell envelope integrity protein TolA [Ramlibacter sp. MAHUQ-53]|uniref:cell envelope integrity protein TolA n=1 Tax=unclassified Ramlibacter TaxID=2617605 RepID=UPI00362C4859
MHVADPQAFAPPPEPGRGRALGLAVLAHLVLVAALTWGVGWKRDPQTLAAEAELWAPTAQEAAPRLVEAPPPPPPPPAPAPRVQAPPPPPAVKDADIALQKQRKAAEEKKKLEAEREKQKKLEAEKAEAKKKQLAEQKRLEDQKKREAAEKLAKAQAQEQAEAKRAEALRQENLRRMQGLAGATGGATATGNALRSAGPSDSYAGRIRARVKPNIVFSDDVPGNPVAEVEVRMAPDGTITSRKVTKSSGNKAWDDAVLRALDRTEVLPRDTDGRVHSPLLMEFRPKG